MTFKRPSNPNIVLLITVFGLLLQVIAYFVSISWYLVPISIGAILAGFCYRVSQISKESAIYNQQKEA